MFHRGTCRHLAYFPSIGSIFAFVSRSLPACAALFVGIALLATPRTTLAQRRGGGGGGAAGLGDAGRSSSVICIYDCANRQGLSSEDSLKNFRHSLAVQATDEQRAAFNKVAQYTLAASDQVKDVQESQRKSAASSSPTDHGLADRATLLDQAIEKARAGNQNFLASFSEAQKSGLKEITVKLAKADSELDKEIKAIDQAFRTASPDSAQLLNTAAGLDEELASFQNEQLALGREMGILLDPQGNGLTLNLPSVTNSITVSDQTVSIPSSATVSRTSAEIGRNLFRLQLAADLSDVQQNITDLLRSSLNRSPDCGERIQIQKAWLAPVNPATLVTARLHLERWVCPLGQRSAGQPSPAEIATADGIIEVRLTPSVAPGTGLALAPEITHVDADGFLRDSLRSGELGLTLRDQIAASILSLIQRGIDLKITLPPAAQAASLQKAQFQDAGADQLTLVLEGQIQFSDEQAQQFADQLKQRLSARESSAP